MEKQHDPLIRVPKDSSISKLTKAQLKFFVAGCDYEVIDVDGSPYIREKYAKNFESMATAMLTKNLETQ